MENIVYIKHAVPEELLSMVGNFFFNYEQYHIMTKYGQGENTKVTTLVLDSSPSIEQNDNFHVQKTYIQKSVIEVIKEKISNVPFLKGLVEKHECFSSSFDIRLSYGPTRLHIDGTNARFYKNDIDSFIFSRVATLILTLSDNKDIIHFPEQNIHLPLEKGSLLLFPSYWTHPHYTTHDSLSKRLSLQTWLLEKNEVLSLNEHNIIQI